LGRFVSSCTSAGQGQTERSLGESSWDGNQVRTFSFGGGVQSTAVLVLQAQNKLPEPYDVFLFANVGDDSEHPDTIEYFHNVHKPFAEKNGIHLEEMEPAPQF
jgi:hypothetical protein